MIPDANNVYGQVVAPLGLSHVLAAVRPFATGGRVRLKTSGYDGATTLHLETDTLYFATTPLGGGEHLFNGGVAGSTAEVVVRVERLSASLSAAGVEHSFEVYDADQNLVCVIPMSTKDRAE
jgi:hypothetical protein